MSQSIPSTDPQLKLIVDTGQQFEPFYSPKDMLILGVYGGNFWYKMAQRNSWLLKTDLFSGPRGLDPILFNGPLYDEADNYFGVAGLENKRTYGMSAQQKRLHPKGWFEWYCNYYYGQLSHADTARIRQWQYEINVQWSYIDGATPTEYTGSGNRATDLTFLPERRQRLLEFGWDPTRNPADYNLTIKF